MDRKTHKKILIFLPWYGLGGSTLYISQYVRYLSNNNYTVYAVCRKKDKGSEYLKSLGAKIINIHFPFTLNFSALDKYNNSIKKKIIDIVKLIGGFIISFFLILIYKPNIVLIGEFIQIPILFSSILQNKKTICLFQTSISNNRIKRKFLFKILKKIDYLVGITDIHIKDIPHVKQAVIIPNIYINEKGLNRNYSFNEMDCFDTKKIVFIGGINKIKGTLEFIKISLELLKLRNDLCFIIIGRFNKSFKTKYAQGNEESDYDYNLQIFELIGDLIDTKFKFLGEIDYVDQVINKCHFLISTNIYPHFSRPIIEAWANKVVVIAYEDIFTKYMEHNMNCIQFIEKDKIIDTTILINALIDNEEKLNNFIKIGFNNYLNHYSYNSIENKLKMLFNP